MPLFYSAIILLTLLGLPLFLALFGLAGLGLQQQGVDFQVLLIDLYRITDSGILLALPLFAFTGFLLSEANTGQRMIRLSKAVLGWMPGGTMLICLLCCAFFTMLTGGSGVTILALGGLLLPVLRQSGFSERFSLGLITSAGSLGLLLAPAIPLILYAVIVQQTNLVQLDMQQLFIAGITPALLMIAALYGYGLYQGRGQAAELQPFDLAELAASFKAGFFELMIPVIVLGGIYSGLLVISEAAAVTALYVLIIELFVYRDLNGRKLLHATRESLVMVGSILLILGAALAFTTFLIDIQLPMQLVEWLDSHIQHPLLFLLLLNIMLLLMGAFLDIFAAIVILVPLILPLALNFGIDPIHLGIIFIANLQLGYFTPPVGMNLFIASYRFGKPIEVLYRASLPFFFVLLGVLLLITYVPAISLWLL